MADQDRLTSPLSHLLAGTYRERLHLAQELHALCAKRLKMSGPGTPSVVKPMQQLSAWQDRLQRQLEVGISIKVLHILDASTLY